MRRDGWRGRRMTCQVFPAEALRRAEEEACRPFDLVAGPLVRGTLYRLSSDEHLLCIVIHHIVFDGWSVGILLRELAAHYEAQRSETSVSLPSLPIQYADYAVWQRSWFQGEALERSSPLLERATAGSASSARIGDGSCASCGADLPGRPRAPMHEPRQGIASAHSASASR